MNKTLDFSFCDDLIGLLLVSQSFKRLSHTQDIKIYTNFAAFPGQELYDFINYLITVQLS